MVDAESELKSLELYLSQMDALFEVGVLEKIRRLLDLGGDPERIIKLLSTSYRGYGTMVYILSKWLNSSAPHPTEQHLASDLIETHLREVASESFDVRRADSIFGQGESAPAWLEIIMQDEGWRTLFRELSARAPGSILLSYAGKRAEALRSIRNSNGVPIIESSTSVSCPLSCSSSLFDAVSYNFGEALHAWSKHEDNVQKFAQDGESNPLMDFRRARAARGAQSVHSELYSTLMFEIGKSSDWRLAGLRHFYKCNAVSIDLAAVVLNSFISAQASRDAERTAPFILATVLASEENGEITRSNAATICSLFEESGPYFGLDHFRFYLRRRSFLDIASRQAVELCIVGRDDASTPYLKLIAIAGSSSDLKYSYPLPKHDGMFSPSRVQDALIKLTQTLFRVFSYATSGTSSPVAGDVLIPCVNDVLERAQFHGACGSVSLSWVEHVLLKAPLNNIANDEKTAKLTAALCSQLIFGITCRCPALATFALRIIGKATARFADQMLESINSIAFALLDTALLLADNGHHKLVLPAMFLVFNKEKGRKSIEIFLYHFLCRLIDGGKEPLSPSISRLILESLSHYEFVVRALKRPNFRNGVRDLFLSFKSSCQGAQRLPWEQTIATLVDF